MIRVAVVPNTRQRPSLRRRLALIAFGAVVGIAAAEIILHFALPDVDFHFPTARLTDDQFSRRAGAAFDGNGTRYAFDADGFRISDTPPATAGVRTVLFLGDSFTQGFGVSGSEAFPATTCDRLRARGITARCLNAGVTGFGTTHELRLLVKVLQRDDLAIDAVVFQVCPYNDLRDNWEDGGFGVEEGKLAVWNPPRVPIGVWLRDALLDNRLARSSRIVTLAANAWFASFPADEKSDASTFELERRLLDEVVATAQGRGIPIVLLVAVTSWEADQVSSQFYDEPGRVNFFATATRELGVPWIDARTIVRAPEHFIPNDGHFSAAGNALVGAALAEQLAPLLRDRPAQAAQ